jgi:hypothetical protein
VYKFNATLAWTVAIGFLIASEVVLINRGQPLLSDVLWQQEGRFPVIPFALGLFAGHIVAAPAAFLTTEQVQTANERVK